MSWTGWWSSAWRSAKPKNQTTTYGTSENPSSMNSFDLGRFLGGRALLVALWTVVCWCGGAWALSDISITGEGHLPPFDVYKHAFNW